jgi:hypothetical protein
MRNFDQSASGRISTITGTKIAPITLQSSTTQNISGTATLNQATDYETAFLTRSKQMDVNI